jgi:hypothetical protein
VNHHGPHLFARYVQILALRDQKTFYAIGEVIPLYIHHPCNEEAAR